MTGRAFDRYMRDRTRASYGEWIEDGDPAVEMFDGTVRIHDQRGESCSIKHPSPHQLRALAFQLQLCAEEIERRSRER